MRSLPLPTVLVLSTVACPALAQTALPLGETRSGTTTGSVPIEFAFQAADPGFLAVILRGTTQGGDLVLSVTDDEYQVLSDGHSDQDLGQDLGAEQVMLRIPAPGLYRVLVESPYEDGMIPFEIGGTYLRTSLAAAAPDPDGRPSQATALDVGATHEDAIDPSLGDGWDWYRITAESDGVLTVLTRARGDEEGDVKLELFRDGEFREADQTSDQDQGEVLTNESVSVDVSAGQTVYVRVGPAFSGGAGASYRIASGLIPG